MPLLLCVDMYGLSGHFHKEVYQLLTPLVCFRRFPKNHTGTLLEEPARVVTKQPMRGMSRKMLAEAVLSRPSQERHKSQKVPQNVPVKRSRNGDNKLLSMSLWEF